MDTKPQIGLREKKKAKTSENIRSTSLKLFKKNGYLSTTLEDIAKEAEVTVPTVLRYFGSKEQIVMYDFEQELLLLKQLLEQRETTVLETLNEFNQQRKQELGRDKNRRDWFLIAVQIPRLAWNELMSSVEDLLYASFLSEMTNSKKNRIKSKLMASIIVSTSIPISQLWYEHKQDIGVIDEAWSQVMRMLKALD